MNKKKTVNKEQIKKPSLIPAHTITYGLGIGIGAVAGFLFGHTTGLCIGSLLGVGIGFLMDAFRIHHSKITKN